MKCKLANVTDIYIFGTNKVNINFTMYFRKDNYFIVDELDLLKPRSSLGLSHDVGFTMKPSVLV